MKKTFSRYLAAISVIALIPLLCSCSLFKKNQVAKAVVEFSEAVKSGDASDILKKTDGLNGEARTAFKSMLDTGSAGEAEKIYIEHMNATISYEIDESSIQIEKDTATCIVNFSIADQKKIEKINGCNDAEIFARSIDKCEKKTVTVELSLAKIKKDWYVTNFDTEVIPTLYSFIDNMPPIAFSDLLIKAIDVAMSVTSDDPALAYDVSLPYDSTGTVSIPEYVKSLFEIDPDRTEEEVVFRTAMLNNMTYRVDETSVWMVGEAASVDIEITMPDYSSLSGKEFKKASDITAAVEACEKMTLTYNCKMTREGFYWQVNNLDSEEYAAFLNYKKFSISYKSVDGTYEAELDITDKFLAYVGKQFNLSLPAGSELEGKIVIKTTLVLKDGKYEITVDNDAFKTNIKTYVEKNIDAIILKMLGTTSTVGLDTLAKIAGYADYNDMKTKILAQVTSELETVNTSGLNSSGTFTVNDNTLTLKSSSDTMSGLIDNFGNISVTSPINDPDAKALLGTDQISVEYKKV